MVAGRQDRAWERCWAYRRLRRWMVALALATPFAAVVSAGRFAVTPLAVRVASPLTRTAAELEALAKQPVPTPLAPTPDAAAIAALDGDEVRAGEGAARPDGDAGPARNAPGAVGILVTETRLMAAVKAGIRPSGSPVPPTAWRPAGLALWGVSALGVGLRDGDVLTRVGGAPARSDGAVIGAVRGALASGARALGAEVWRGRLAIVVTVMLPDVRAELERNR